MTKQLLVRSEAGTRRTRGNRILRDINEMIVLNVVRERQPISRTAIAGMTGLEEGTVSRIMHRMLRQRLVVEAGAGPSTPAGGRKPRYVQLNPRKTCAIGVDLGAMEATLALSDFNGRLQRVSRLPNTRDPQRFLPAVADEIMRLIGLAGDYKDLGGIGVSIIGLVDTEEGIILEGQNAGWGEFVEVGKILRSRIPASVPMFFENAARLSALGQLWFGGARLSGFRELVFVEINEGIGTGIVIDGQLYTGSRRGAGEFGHVTIDPSGPRCSCENYGCFEALACDPATVARYRLTANVPDEDRIDMDRVVELARQRDPAALQAVKETARYLGWGLAPIIYGLDPEAIVIGGKIAALWPEIEPEVRAGCAERVTPLFMSTTTLLCCPIQETRMLLGAVALVLSRSFATPEIP